MKYAVQLVMAFFGFLGFAGIFNIKQDKLFPAAFGGFLAWAVYLVMGLCSSQDPVRFFVASLIFTVYAEIMARIKKTPATIFLVPAAIPLIPGGSLYKTMWYALKGQRETCIHQAGYTLLLAVAIACGILCAMTIWAILENMTHSKRMEQK